MGKTKVKIIDDAQQKDKLVARLKEELGVDQKDSERLRKPENQISGKSDISETTGKPSLSEKKSEKPSKTKPRSKKYQQAILQVDRQKKYPLPEAVGLAQKTSYSKFPGTLEVHINTTTKNIKGCEPNGQVIHLAVGKVNQSANDLTTNIKSLYQTIGKSRISKITLSATMGPGVKVDLASL